MFETSLMLAITKWGQDGCQTLDDEYFKCWQGIQVFQKVFLIMIQSIFQKMFSTDNPPDPAEREFHHRLGTGI